eukprot:jgi/Mesvir1/823/Mv17406-RA.2
MCMLGLARRAHQSVLDLQDRLSELGSGLLVAQGLPEEVLPRLCTSLGAAAVYAQKETCLEETQVERRVRAALAQCPSNPQGATPSSNPALTRPRPPSRTGASAPSAANAAQSAADRALSGSRPMTSSSPSALTSSPRPSPSAAAAAAPPAASPALHLVWGATMYHRDDLPYARVADTPDVFTQFRKAVESRSSVRRCYELAQGQVKPLPGGGVAAHAAALGAPGQPTREELLGWCGALAGGGEGGLDNNDTDAEAEAAREKGVLRFVGGESAALARLKHYFWESDCVQHYKETRNGMLGADYSTKFSPWLAHGCLSPRFVYAEIKRYERDRVANDSTYWVLFELLWRDYFRFVCEKYGNRVFLLGGPRGVTDIPWKRDAQLFAAWCEGRTGYPLVDANMRELRATGFMSNRGRQIVCSFLTRDLGLDWRMGAEWFEAYLLDYDPCSNYGNWTYGAGVGNDPREDRYFSLSKQGQNYDADGAYVSHWCPELASVPMPLRHFPGTLTPAEQEQYGVQLGVTYPRPIAPLKHGGERPAWVSKPGGPGMGAGRGGGASRINRSGMGVGKVGGRGMGRGGGRDRVRGTSIASQAAAEAALSGLDKGQTTLVGLWGKRPTVP